MLSFTYAYGVSYNPYAGQLSWKHILFKDDLNFIVILLNHRHCLYLNKIQKQLCNECETSVSITTLLYALCHLHYSRKGASAYALERDNLLHSAFMNRIADEITNLDMLMFVDKAAYNKRTLARMNGWSLVGTRCMQRRCFDYRQRFLILPILTLNGIITYDIIPELVTS